jgi:hypothetical protein
MPRFASNRKPADKVTAAIDSEPKPLLPVEKLHKIVG